MKFSPQLESSPELRACRQPRVKQLSERSRAGGPEGLHQRRLAPASMWAELEHYRKIADQLETPFSLLIITSRSAMSPASQLMQPSRLPSLRQFADVLGPIGMLDRKRFGVVIRTHCEDEICKFVDSVQDQVSGGFWELKVLTYPMSLDKEVFFPDTAGRWSPLVCGSLQPLFALPTPLGKRAIDVLSAALGLLILLPFLLLVAVLIRCTSAGPIFFKQRRSGLGGVPFDIYKFRTMVVNAERHQALLKHLNEQDGPAFKMKHDPRVTGLGRLLRFTCIDELPQLWNVLRGEMSLVGPRPLPCEESDACRWWQRRRLDVLPGLTCTWQARGRSMVSFNEWMRMDLDYVRRRSLALDFQIVLGTISFLISRNASRPVATEVDMSFSECSSYTTQAVVPLDSPLS